MPFTPLHMGPGLALKAVGGERVSLIAFGTAQVLIDLEPLVRILRGDAILHGPTHTYLGATLVALVAAVASRPLGAWLLARWPEGTGAFGAWLRGPGTIGWPAAFTGALLGTWSHVFLDSIMHADMSPWAPWQAGNPLLRVISIGDLHLVCLVSAAVGLGLVFLRYWRHTTRR